jgi:uncharacterized protein YecE (DUF72 family)
MSRQSDLFEDLSAAVPAVPAHCPADRDPEMRRLSSLLPQSIRLGTSSWAFPGWAGTVYERTLPERLLAREGLPAYALHPLLRTVGIDRSFYAPLPEADYGRYAEQVPETFRFLVKAPQALTSDYLFETREASPHFLDPRAARDLFVGPCTAGLGAKAGPLVFQFPPLRRGFTRERRGEFASRLAKFLRDLPPGPLYAVEFRDRELLASEIMQALAASGTRLCLSIHARMPPVQVQAAAATALGPGSLVVRWNLHAGFAYEEAKARYAPFDKLVDEDPGTRMAIARLCRECAESGGEAWVIANNKAEGSAPLTLERLARAIVDGGAVERA